MSSRRRAVAMSRPVSKVALLGRLERDIVATLFRRCEDRINEFPLSEFKTPTPLEPAPASVLAFAGREEVWLKREDLNPLGVFKWRSTLPVVRHLLDSGATEIVTCSTGNHGAAVAWA